MGCQFVDLGCAIRHRQIQIQRRMSLWMADGNNGGLANRRANLDGFDGCGKADRVNLPVLAIQSWVI